MTASRAAPQLTVGFVLAPDFTLLALAAFLDTLRLAADEGDRSRAIDCSWMVMSEDGAPVRASNGVRVQPDTAFVDPARFDYLVVVGGTMHRGPEVAEATRAYLARAAAAHVPLVGVCTGGFVLARSGLMQGRRCCVSWFHQAEMETEFPEIEVVADQLFVVDRDRITCAGGTSVIHLASFLVEKHVGAGRSSKGLRVMLEDRIRPASSPQPAPTIAGLDEVRDPRVRRAMLLMERHLASSVPVAAIAQMTGTTTRQLNRLFSAAIGRSPAAFRETLRLERAHQLVVGTALPLTDIALRSGFADGSHFTRRFKRRYGTAPLQARRSARAGVLALHA